MIFESMLSSILIRNFWKKKNLKKINYQKFYFTWMDYFIVCWPQICFNLSTVLEIIWTCWYLKSIKITVFKNKKCKKWTHNVRITILYFNINLSKKIENYFSECFFTLIIQGRYLIFNSVDKTLDRCSINSYIYN